MTGVLQQFHNVQLHGYMLGFHMNLYQVNLAGGGYRVIYDLIFILYYQIINVFKDLKVVTMTI